MSWLYAIGVYVCWVVGTYLSRRFRRLAPAPLEEILFPNVGAAVGLFVAGPAYIGSLQRRLGDTFLLPLGGKLWTFALNPAFLARFYTAPSSEFDLLESLAAFGFDKILGADGLHIRGSEFTRLVSSKLVPRFSTSVDSVHDELRFYWERQTERFPPASSQCPNRSAVLEVNEHFGRCIVAMSARMMLSKTLARNEKLHDLCHSLALESIAFAKGGAQNPFSNTGKRCTAIRSSLSELIRSDLDRRSRLRDSGAVDDELQECSFMEDLATYAGKGGPFGEYLVGEKMIGMIFATTINTPQAGAYALFNILSNANVKQRVVSEVAQVVAEHGSLASAGAFDSLRYLMACMHETMRIISPFTHVRIAVAQNEVNGYAVPARSIVAVSPYVRHRQTDIWTNPESFEPERFLERAEDQKEKYSYLPWGWGKHRCLGMKLAEQEVVLTIAYLFQQYAMDIVNKPSHDWLTGGLARPMPFLVRFTKI